MKKILLALIALFSLMGCYAQQKPVSDSIMITIFLKHQEDKNLKEINAKLDANKFHEMFPPKFARIVSWYVMMGVGQVVTLKFPASKLRDVNLTLENGAWGAFNTQFYPTYDYYPVWKASQQNKNQ